MSVLTAYRVNKNHFDIQPLPIERGWMEETSQRHAYRCFPVTLANTIGWFLSAPEDISFVWDGTIDQSGQSIKILSGEKYCYSGRGQGTLSFYTGLIFESEQEISLLSFTPPNYFNPDFTVVSSLISTSFYRNDLPLAIRALQPNKTITIKAGDPIAAILPISLTKLKEESITLKDFIPDPGYYEKVKSYGDVSQEINQAGKWTDFYRNAVDEKGNSLGQHEVKSLRLKVINERSTRFGY